MDIQKQIAFEKFQAKDSNCDYEELKQRLDHFEKLSGHRYLPTSPRHEAWLVWNAAWQAAQAVPEWISTSERMPEEGEEVFVHSYGQVRQATRDSSWAGGFKERNCYGWQATYGQSHWIPKNIKLPEQYHFYYENDAKQKTMLEAQE